MKHLRVLAMILWFATAVYAQQFAAPASLSTQRGNAYILCGTGFTEGECRTASGVVRVALKDIRVDIQGWRWVIVPNAQWEEFTREFGVKSTVPAFSSFALASTYVQQDLIFPNLPNNDNLRSYTSLTGFERLRWVLAHESGHILCRTSDDGKAEAAAKRIQSGNSVICP